MNVRRVTTRLRLSGGRSASVGIALVVTLLAAIRALEPAAHAGGGFLLEVAGYLSVGLLVLCASRVTAQTMGIGRRPGRYRRGLLGRLAARTLIDAGFAIVLALPALTAAWEAGASRADVRTVTLGLLAAPVFGIACGAVFGRIGLPAIPAALLAVGLAALLLWPASLGWTVRLERSFPGPELSVLLLVIELSLVAVLGWATFTQRRVMT
jgi:hypothetical protein